MRSLNCVMLREQSETTQVCVVHIQHTYAHACVNVHTIYKKCFKIFFFLVISLLCGSQVSQVYPELGTYVVHSKPPVDIV